MAKQRFLIVGSGWRSLFYLRIAKALPERFEVCAMLCRTAEKAERMQQEYGVRTSTSEQECIAMQPDFVVVAVNKASIPAVCRQWAQRGFAVLCETPAALDEATLHELWALHEQGAKIQIAEQYWRYPTLERRIHLAQSGILGQTKLVRLSVAHTYHAASLARRFLGLCPQPVRITGQSWAEPVIETDSRWGLIEHGAEKTFARQLFTLEFSTGKLALVDFCSVQYHTLLRSSHTSVQGERGELFDDTLRCLDAAGVPFCRTLTPQDSPASPLRLLAIERGLSEDETAIAQLMDGMAAYQAGGAEVYPFADALEDAYLAILMEQSLAAPCVPVQSTPQPWHQYQ